MSRYAASDWHGNLEIAKKILNYLKPDDELYFLGDAADRGDDGYEVIKLLLSDKRVTYFKGNHEDMLCIVMEEIIERGTSENIHWWVGNGGYETMSAITKLSIDNQKSLVRIINKLPVFQKIVNNKGQEIILSHAGVNPFEYKDYLTGREIPYPPSERELLWNRSHYRVDWKDGYDNTYIIHGHTPIQLLTRKENDDKVLKYAKGHKIDLDLCTIKTNKAALLDIDNLDKVIYFEGGKKIDN